VRGVKVQVAFGEYTVPAVSLRLHFDHAPERKILANTQADPDEWAHAAIKFLLAVLARNYPGLTEEQFLDTISEPDLAALLIAATRQSGYTDRPLVKAEEKSSPEPSSSATSSVPPDGSPTTSSTG
jgi:hypothetical protein